MNDTDLATLVRDAVRDTHMTVPESDITRRARRLRTRRRAAAGGAVSVGLAAAALAVATLAAPASSPATGQARNTAQLTAWTVTKDPDGVIDVTIRELKDPAGLQARLRADGVPAVVTFLNSSVPACQLDKPYYWSLLEHPQVKPLRIVTITPHYLTDAYPAGRTLLVIHPALIPHGDALNIGADFGDRVGLGWDLVKTSPACTGLCRITGEDERAGGDPGARRHQDRAVARYPVDGGAADLPDPLGDAVHAVDAGLAELAVVRVHRQPTTEFDPAVGDERRGPRHARRSQVHRAASAHT